MAVLRFLAAVLLVGASFTGVAQQTSNGKHQVDLPSSKSLTLPAPGAPQTTNSFPTAVALSPDGRYLAILNNGRGAAESGFRQSIAILTLADNRVQDFPDARLGLNARQTYFLGLAWSGDGNELFASIASLTDPEGKRPGSTGNGIAVYKVQDGAISPERFLKLPLTHLDKSRKFTYSPKTAGKGHAISYPAGLAVIHGGSGEQLLVAENLADDVVLLDAASGKILQRFDLSAGKFIPTAFPYAVVASRDGRRAWCSLWNTSQVAELDLSSGKVVRRISLLAPEQPTSASSHATALLLSPDGNWIYTTLSNSDAVAVVNTADADDTKVDGYLDTRLPGQTYGGTYPNALALSSDGETLYVANAASDAVAVFNLRKKLNHERASYFIPTEWYPTALAVHDGSLFIAAGKGSGTGPNATIENDPEKPGKQHHPYIASLIRGSIARISLKEADRERDAMTEEVLRSNLMEGRTGEIAFSGGHNPIRHVIYILKENRGYDQVFGDIANANSYPALVMYGEAITPNQHKLALQFGVLDNFYDSGEVSGDGHSWSTAAITSDYDEKTYPIVYRGRERDYDYEGGVGDASPLKLGIADVNEPGTGYLWGNLARNHRTYRNYGEYVNTWWCEDIAQNSPASTGAPTGHPPDCSRRQVKPGEELPAQLGGGRSPYGWNIPLMAYDVANKPELVGHFDPNAADFKVEYPDQFRADEFLREFAGFVKARQSGEDEALPEFVLLRLPDDHTEGTRPGAPTPNASIADNDLAVGRVVEAVSNSPYWDDTAIFVLEDDAQDGADHVDAHRSIALVISKYAPGNLQQPFVDHHFYTTVNVIHSMEALLGLPPMNNNDARAPVMAPLFTGAGNQPPFRADYRNRDNGMIYQANTAHSFGAKASAKMDFSREDRVNTAVLNAILWRLAKGNVPVPAPRHTVFPAEAKSGDDDDK